MKDQKGFSFLEITAGIAIIAIVGAVVSPMVANAVKAAKLRRAETDTKVIATAIADFNRDMREWPIWKDGKKTTPNDHMYDVLYTEAGDGCEDSHATGKGHSHHGHKKHHDSKWGSEHHGHHGSKSSDHDNTSTIDGQLVSNSVDYPLEGSPSWTGPYLTNIDSDPWGGKYYVNVMFLHPEFLSPGNEHAVFALSPGPNEKIDTAFHQKIDDKFEVGGDDIIFRIK